MSFRGGRGGRGFGRGGKLYVENKPFVYFPPEVELPVVKSVTNDELHLIASGYRLQKFWGSSPYNLSHEEGPKKEGDKKNLMNARKRKLYDFIKCGIEHVPAELAEDPSRSRHNIRKKVQWTQESEWQKLDLFEKLEQKHKDAKGEDKEEEEEVEEEEEEQEEESSDDDYNQNVDFDDDEDDYNMEDDGKDDEPIY